MEQILETQAKPVGKPLPSLRTQTRWIDGLLLISLTLMAVVWLVPFVAAVALEPVKENNRLLFESIMPVVVCIAATAVRIRPVDVRSPVMLR